MSAVLNPKIDNRSSSASADAHGLELMAGNESGGPVTQISPKAKSVCGSNAAESMASVAGLSFLSSDGVIGSRSKARVVTGAISWMWPTGSFKPCSSGRRGTVAAVSNPSKIKSPRMSAT